MRVYAITYDLYEPQGGAFKYADKPVKENQVIYYNRFERDEFIKRFQVLTSTEKEMYIDNVRCYFGELKEIENMDDVINAI